MERKLPILIDNRMARIRPALITDNNIRPVRKRVNDLTLSFVSPVRSNYSLYHVIFLLFQDLWMYNIRS
jgi:hypothetical protein